MLNLSSTSDLLKLVTDAAAQIEVHASWVDNASGTLTPGRTNTADIVTAATTTIVASPASSTTRNVRYLNIHNSHATVACTCTVHHTDGTTDQTLWSGVLQPGESVLFVDLAGWIRLSSGGAHGSTAGSRRAPPRASRKVSSR